MFIRKEDAIEKIKDSYYDTITDGKMILEKLDETKEFPTLPVVYVDSNDNDMIYTIDEIADSINVYKKFEERGVKHMTLKVSDTKHVFSTLLN